MLSFGITGNNNNYYIKIKNDGRDNHEAIYEAGYHPYGERGRC
jgi:hypothetical protein